MVQAAHSFTPSPFIAKLLAPITDAIDPHANRRFAREVRDARERRWRLAQHGYYAVQAYREHCTHMLRAAEIVHRRFDLPEAAEAARAQLSLVKAIDRLMATPAPTIGALRLKQKLRKVDGGRDRWEQAIMRDEQSLTGKV